jgi:hypothetical protein
MMIVVVRVISMDFICMIYQETSCTSSSVKYAKLTMRRMNVEDK